ncbi:uncharacterized protein LOC111912910 [Lactuca sativa]|uniref:uncharacterized protein LOC111912910 n=1 Tax=Lactuca sativa TaxID=4236 RepID=UPI000CD8A897|nr:uncharacterized protein LOC111912910 [Lactuca sativa]
MAIWESPDTMDDYMRMFERTARETWKGEYTSDHHGSPSLVLEAVASQDLWIWHAFFGVAGSNNDINVLDQLSIFEDLLNGKDSDAPFTMNGNEYKYGYYLTDGLYPQYSTFVKEFRHPVEEREIFLKRRQERAHKDVERTFGVLRQSVEDKWRNIAHYIPTEPRHVQFQPGTAEYLHRVVDIQDANKHRQFREDLADYVFYGNNNDNE